MLLYHYYEESVGPFRSISDLSDEEAEEVLKRIRTEKPDIFISKRPDDYLKKEEVSKESCVMNFGKRVE